MAPSLSEPTDNGGRGRRGRRQVERPRSTVQERYRLLFEENPMPMWLFDVRTLRFLDVNDAAVRQYGYSREEFLSMTIRDIRPEEDVPRLVEDLEGSRASPRTVGIWRHRKKDGTIIHVEISAHEFTFGGGRARLVLSHDVTDRMRMERYRAVEYAVTKALAESRTLREAAPRLLQAIAEASGWPYGEIWRVDATQDALVWDGAWDAGDPRLEAFAANSRALTARRGEGLAGRVWASRAASWIPDVAENSFTRRATAARAGLHGAFAFPILTPGEVSGIMAFFSRDVRDPDDAFLEMMAELGHRIGQFVEREASERTLRESEARRAAMLDTALDCVIAMDHEGRIVDFNPAAERTFGYRPDEIIGKTLAETLVPPALRDAHRRGLARYLETGEGPVLGRRIELTAIRKDGTEFPVEIAISRIQRDGPPAFVGFVRDISGPKEMERRLVESERLAALGKVAAYVAHEINTPLTNIALLTATASRRTQDPEVLSRLGKIDIQRRLTTEFIQDLMGLTRPVTLAAIETDVRTAIDSALDQVEPYLRDTVALRKEMADRPIIANVDPTRLQQVIVNLVKNALQATDQGSVTVRLEERPGAVAIAVSDTGPGMPKDVQEKLFQPFFTTKPRGQGTGLGLAFTKSIVSAHGGTIEVTSEAGKGSTFTVVLPKTPPAS